MEPRTRFRRAGAEEEEEGERVRVSDINKVKLEGDQRSDALRRQQREKDAAATWIHVNDVDAADLRAIALKHNVPVAEIKRINNIFSDSEIFALKRIKVPGRPMQSVQEPTSEWRVRHHFAPSPPSTSTSTPGHSTPEHPEGDADADQLRAKKDVKKARKIFKAVDNDLIKIRTQIESQSIQGDDGHDDGDDDYGEEERLLATATSTSLTPPPKSRLWCWCCLVLVVISVIVILLIANYEFKVIEQEFSHGEEDNSTSNKEPH